MADPHENDPEENPLDHLGEELPDPWDDPEQKDWTDHTLPEVGR